MARIEMISESPDDERLIAMFDEVTARWPRVPNLYRVLGNAPEMLRAWLDIAWPLRLEATTPRRTRELIILRGAQISKSSYEWAHHVPMALDAGVSQAEIDGLETWRSLDSLTKAEQAALRLAEEVTEGPQASAECIAAMKQHFSDAEVVELVMTASFYVCVARVLGSLAVDLEPGFEAPW